MTTDELVSVLVPKKHLTEVYGFLARLGGASQGPSATALSGNGGGSYEAPDREGSVNMDEWTPSRLRTMVNQSPKAMLDILNALAERAGEWLSMEELARSIRHKPDADWNTVAGTFGAFGRRVRNRYELETWPFENRYDHDVGGRVCRMHADIARLVKQYLPPRDE